MHPLSQTGVTCCTVVKYLFRQSSLVIRNGSRLMKLKSYKRFGNWANVLVSKNWATSIFSETLRTASLNCRNWHWSFQTSTSNWYILVLPLKTSLCNLLFSNESLKFSSYISFYSRKFSVNSRAFSAVRIKFLIRTRSMFFEFCFSCIKLSSSPTQTLLDPHIHFRKLIFILWMNFCINILSNWRKFSNIHIWNSPGISFLFLNFFLVLLIWKQ